MNDTTESAVFQDYLKTIYSATEWGGKAISVTGLAQRLSVAPSTASETIKRLAQADLVVHEPYRGVKLSDAGLAQALTMLRRHRILETYLHERLNFDWDEVHEEAEALEHAVSDRLIDRMDDELGRPTHDPHGDPIPDATGAITYVDSLPLSKLPEGKTSEVLRICDRDPDLLRLLRQRGISPGAEVRMVASRSYAGMVSIRIGEGAELELSEVAAAAVWVRA